MNKNNLKTGMTVEDRRGFRAKVLLGTANGDILAGTDESRGKHTWSPLSFLSSDLRTPSLLSPWTTDNDRDIIKVYDMNSNIFGASTSRVGDLLWTRNEKMVSVCGKKYSEASLKRMIEAYVNE